MKRGTMRRKSEDKSKKNMNDHLHNKARDKINIKTLE